MEKSFKIIIGVFSFLSTVIIAIIGFELHQNSRMADAEVIMSAHGVRINHLGKTTEEIKSVRRDVAAVREQLARIAVILEQDSTKYYRRDKNEYQ
ncbi:MAG: hypothetical protein GY716_06690 [bacterium]|nr:hypothetical protein [bacterium]